MPLLKGKSEELRKLHNEHSEKVYELGQKDGSHVQVVAIYYEDLEAGMLCMHLAEDSIEETLHTAARLNRSISEHVRLEIMGKLGKRRTM